MRFLEHLESLGTLWEDLLYASSPVMCGKKQIDNLDDEFHVFLLSCQFSITFSVYSRHPWSRIGANIG